MSRRLAGFLVLSLGAHALAFSLFRDPGEFSPIPAPGSGRVSLFLKDDHDMGLVHLFEPSSIVLPKEAPIRMAGTVTLPWEELSWPSQKSFTVGGYRPSQLGRDAPLAVRATTSLGFYRNGMREKSAVVAVGRAVPESWFELAGDLKNRKTTKAIQLPAMKSATALEPTTARIGVDEDGAVRFVCLEGTTGDPIVDREASTLLRSWRFEPTPGKWVEWGRVRILWAVDNRAMESL